MAFAGKYPTHLAKQVPPQRRLRRGADVFPESARKRIGVLIEWVVANLIKAAILASMHAGRFLSVQWSGADAAEDGDLIA